ncbi:hypothetical protein CS006_08450 [Bifidobacterium primatium]|uniref:Uncharacterized protein n=2 Tax=Bifidobacterium primatium TaxID=2045438 RepID=A0A2M9H733_9BIFI|nr:hypothetical protein CS006_08450 [Bifidobacterium primatium]
MKGTKGLALQQYSALLRIQRNSRSEGVLTMTQHQCTIAGCDEPAEASGLCERHFTRALVYGQFRTPRHQSPVAAAAVKRQ